MRRIKVAYFTDIPGMGGGETSLLNQLIALRQHPEIVTVLFLFWSRKMPGR